MHTKFVTMARKAASLALATAAFLAGCGEPYVYNTDPGDLGPADQRAKDMSDVAVELTRVSTRCESAATPVVTATVATGVEFSADEVGGLGSPCPEGVAPAVEIDIDGRSVLFDFANVTEDGEFPAAELEGYALSVAEGSVAPFLVTAVIDRDATNVEVADADLFIEHDRLEVNFDGVRFDAGSFVKVDLYFADVESREAD